MHQIAFGMTHLWNDCQEEDFVSFLKTDSPFCRTADRDLADFDTEIHQNRIILYFFMFILEYVF